MARETKWRPNTGAGSTAHSQALSGRLAASPSLEALGGFPPPRRQTHLLGRGTCWQHLWAPCSALPHVTFPPKAALKAMSAPPPPWAQGEKQSLRTSRLHAHPQTGRQRPRRSTSVTFLVPQGSDSSVKGSLLLSGPTCPDSGSPHPSLLQAGLSPSRP